MAAFSYEINRDGIAILTFDLPGEKVNKLTTAVMKELDRLLDELAAKKDIRALVFRSGKNTFIVGADIAEIRNLTDSSVAEQLARKGQSVFAKLEALPFPTVAAVHGPCMGGGMELALACTYRVISDDPLTALALPEVRLGLIPGFGGTQRLPRLAGLSNSLDMILSGKSVFAAKAGKTGIADEVTHKEILLDRAIATAQKAIGSQRPTKIRARRPIMIRVLEGNSLTRQLIYRAAEKKVLRETRGNYPAPLAALDAVRYGLSHERQDGYAQEARLVGRLIPTDVSKNLISVFSVSELLKKETHPSRLVVSQAAVIGAGVMGGGIAQLLAEKGITVRMKDINTRAVGAGLREAWNIFRKRLQKGKLTAIQARDGFDRITGTTDYAGFGTAEVAIEAVLESMDVKKSVLRDFEAFAGERAIFASNTSSLSVSEMATASKRPQNVVGMHFFNPVETMPLVEIVRGKETSGETVQAAATLSRRLGKLPVVVQDGPGFLVNRILMPYLAEALLMLEEGGRIEEIDEQLLRFGMPMGAFILLDEVGIDIAHKVSEILHRDRGERAKPSGLLGTLYKEGHFGRKNHKGFYLYQGGKRVKPDPFIYTKIRVPAAGRATPGGIVERPLLLMIKEAVLCIEDKIVDRPDLLDAALIFGIGFPAFRGGLLKYADSLGAKAIVERLEAFTKKHGHRFTPPVSLIEMAGKQKKFYS